VCEVPGRALADDAPRYAISGLPVEVPTTDLEPLARAEPRAEDLLELLALPNVRDRRPIWRRYDHMNGTNTVVRPGAGDAAMLRVTPTRGAVALAIDGPGPARVGALDPFIAGASAVVEGATNVACSGAEPIGITDCLNFASPETDAGAWQLERAIDGIAAACAALDLPVVSGNVSLYNETPDGPILPTPVIGTVGLLADRALRVPMAWRDGDEIWLLGHAGDDPNALAGSELAWARGLRGGARRLDLAAAARVVRLLPRLARHRIIGAAHDASTGGLGVALARMAIAAGLGARVEVSGRYPTAALFGERAGRVVVGVAAGRGGELAAALEAAQVTAKPIGQVGGAALQLGWESGGMSVGLDALQHAWRTGF
jgi:phosphoribosylformylglycinamidine synthase